MIDSGPVCVVYDILYASPGNVLIRKKMIYA